MVCNVTMIIEISLVHIHTTIDSIHGSRRRILPDGAFTAFIGKSIVSSIVSNPDIKPSIQNSLVITIILDHIVICIEKRVISTILNTTKGIQNQICIVLFLGSIFKTIRLKVPSHRIGRIESLQLRNSQIYFSIDLRFGLAIGINVNTIGNIRSLSTLHITNQIFVYIGSISITSRYSTNDSKLNILRITFNKIPVNIILIF